mmetsp:Transcript_12902/g.51923  ORF Transcript_12902/g.51923 Transcript_12902/m.51923 type:complete len:530 (+) Transcript_12902:206-1795(+)
MMQSNFQDLLGLALLLLLLLFLACARTCGHPSKALSLGQAILQEHVEHVVVWESLPVDESGGHVGDCAVDAPQPAVRHHDHAVTLLHILQAAVAPVAVHHAAVVHLHHAAPRALHHHTPRAHLPDGHHLPVGSHHLPGLHHVPARRHSTATLSVGRHHLWRAHPGAAVDHPHLDCLRRAAGQHGGVDVAVADHDGSVGSADRGGSDPAAGPALHHVTVESDRRHEPRPTPGHAAAVDALQALEVEAILLQVARNVLAGQTLDAHEVEDALGHSLVDAELVDGGHKLLMQLRAPHHARLLERAVVLVLIFAAAILDLVSALVALLALLALGAAAAAVLVLRIALLLGGALAVLAAALAGAAAAHRPPVAAALARAQVPLRALALAANDVLPDVAELLDAHGLEEVVHGAVDDTAEDHVGGAVRGHHHDWYVELERDVLQELEAIHVRHVHVGEHDVEVVLALAQGLQRLGTAREGGDFVLASLEHLLDNLQAQRVVVDYENPQADGEPLRRRRGRHDGGARVERRGARRF